MCFPKVCMLKPNPQCDVIWRWGLWEVLKSWELCPYKRSQRASLPLPAHEVIVRRQPSMSLEASLHRFCVYKPSSLWYFVTALQTDKHILQNQFKYHLFNKIFKIPPCKVRFFILSFYTEFSFSIFIGCDYINKINTFCHWSLNLPVTENK